MTDELVGYRCSAGVVTVTLDSPANRNALSGALVEQLLGALDRAADAGDVRVVVLTHTGGTFCAGADLVGALAAGASPREAAASGTSAMVRLLRAIVESPVPVVARLDGHVRAGGVGLVAACDIVVAGPATTFAVTEARLGLAPSVISMTVLPRMTSRAAARYFLTGERFDARVAREVGLVTIDVPDGADLDPAVAELTAGITRASPQGIQASKALANRTIRDQLDRHCDALAAESAALFDSDEAREGMTAFLEKRAPSWAMA